MTHQQIPWTPEEDQAFTELGERLTANRLSPAPITPRPGRPSSHVARAGTTSQTDEPRRSVNQAGLTTPEGQPVSNRKLSASPVVPVLGIWLLYAYMFAWALEAVR